ncbi:MAG: TniB family NTP-binding protein, partial [Terriglobia bacterium]
VMHHTADWLKGLVDETRMALVVVGLPTSRIIIEQNEQLTGRFLAPIGLPRFKWSDPEHREEFSAILEAFHSALSEHFDLPELYAEEMAFRCYCATGGLIGYLTKFLRQAVWNVADARKKTITLGDLAVAHQAAVWSTTDMSDTPNPFSKKFQCSPSSELMCRVARLGVPIEGQPVRRGGRHKGIALETAGEIFKRQDLV